MLGGLLDTRSFFSEGDGVSSPKVLVRKAAEVGYQALALTDYLSVGGIVELHQHARTAGLAALTGATVPLATEAGDFPVVLLCSSRKGYQNLNRLITFCRFDSQEAITLPQLAEFSEDLHLLTGGRAGFPSRLASDGRHRALADTFTAIESALPGRVFVQLYFDYRPWDARRIAALRRMAREQGLLSVAAPEVRYAAPEDFPLYDALVCAREGITVGTPHHRRPQTRANWLRSPSEWARLLPWTDAQNNTRALCRELPFDLQPERMVPPIVRVPEGHSPDSYLRELCTGALDSVYGPSRRDEAARLLEKELRVIHEQGFSELFLACREIIDFCAAHGILCSARGSAAASITCRLLGVSKIDPLEHDLLFERFLFQGQASAPDIDIDVSSERRDEVLAWIETRFGGDVPGVHCEAMVSNRITYRTPLALQDLGRAVGLPPVLRNRVTRALGRDFRRTPPRELRRADEQLSEVLGDAPVKETLYRVLERMERGHFRHFAPHSGGVVLSEQPLSWYSPQYRSANGIRALQFDKDDVEWLGLIKLDVLSLRALSALEDAVAEVYRMTGKHLDVWNLPLEDAVWDMIGAGDTMTLFQIESPGQMGLSTTLKPRTMQELADQEALHRPGPIQSGSRRPYIARKLGRERVTYVHERLLKPILQKTHGVLLYQEQVVRIARHVAGMSWADADRFRKKVQKTTDEEALSLRREFIAGVLRTHDDVSEVQATSIFEMCAGFTGFGFAESHSVSFAHITYATAWLMLHYPAEWLAVFLTVHPGMWPRETLRMTCKRRKIPLLGVSINSSGSVFRVELTRNGDKAIRMALIAIKGVTAQLARNIRWEAGLRRFKDVADLLQRVPAAAGAIGPLVRAGAFDGLQGRREALYEAYALTGSGQPGQAPLFEPVIDRPALRSLGVNERVAWDLELMGMSSSRLHPLDLLRTRLRDLGVLPLPLVQSGGPVRTAGLVVGLQRPPTAKGVAFAMIEDGERLAQVVIRPDLWRDQYRLLRDARLLLITGDAHISGLTLTITAEALHPIDHHERDAAEQYRRSGW